MKKVFSLAMLSALGYAVYRFITGQQHTESLWREATRDLDTH
jgi:hypothetical protein